MRHRLRKQREIHSGALNNGTHQKDDSLYLGIKHNGDRMVCGDSRFFRFNSMLFILFLLAEKWHPPPILSFPSLSNKFTMSSIFRTKMRNTAKKIWLKSRWQTGCEFVLSDQWLEWVVILKACTGRWENQKEKEFLWFGTKQWERCGLLCLQASHWEITSRRRLFYFLLKYIFVWSRRRTAERPTNTPLMH